MQKGAALIRLGATLNGFRMQVKVKVGALARFREPSLIPLRGVMLDVGLLSGHAPPTCPRFYQAGT